jgi:hypothetical protein
MQLLAQQAEHRAAVRPDRQAVVAEVAAAMAVADLPEFGVEGA